MGNLLSRLHALRSSSLLKNTGWMIVGQGGNFFLQAGYFLLVARLLGVTEYGVFAGAFALVNTVAPYASLGTQMVFMRHVSAAPHTARVYWGNLFAVTLATTALLALVLSAVSSRFLGHGSAPLVAVLVVSNCLMTQMLTNASVAFQTFERLRETAALRTLGNFLRFVAIGVLVLTRHQASALVCAVALLVATTVGAALSMLWTRRMIGRMQWSLRLLRQRLLESLGFAVAGSTQAVYNDFDKMLLSHFGMNAADGIYTVAYRIVDFATTPVSAIDGAVLPRFFALSTEGIGKVMQLARKIIPLAALAGLGSALFTLVAAPPLVHLVGHGFAASLVAVRWLCWLPVLRGVHQMAGGVLTSTGRQNYRTLAQMLIAVVNLVLNFMWIPSHGWLGAAWASLISDGLLGLVNLMLIFFITARAAESQPTQAGAGS